MKKTLLFALGFMCVSLISCSTKNEKTDVLETESSLTTVSEQTSETTEMIQPGVTETTLSEMIEETQVTETEYSQPDITGPSDTDETVDSAVEQSESKTGTLTEAQALDAIKNYCFINNPDLKSKAESGEYSIYWDVTTNDTGEIVVLYRSYTGAQSLMSLS